MRIITGHQPVYLPWLGLFHKILLADAFVFMDDVQYLQQDWNNRNRIKGPHGAFWLTVPVQPKASASSLLKDILIDNTDRASKNHWQANHWQSLQHCYRRAPYWEKYAAFFEELYTNKQWRFLAELNEYLLRYFLEVLDIQVEFIRASQHDFAGRKSDLVLDHCRRLQADLCVLGTQGRDYIIADDFLQAKISLYYQDYQHPCYEQRFGELISHLSIVDLLFNCGPESRSALLSGNVVQSDLREAVTRQTHPAILEI